MGFCRFPKLTATKNLKTSRLYENRVLFFELFIKISIDAVDAPVERRAAGLMSVFVHIKF